MFELFLPFFLLFLFFLVLSIIWRINARKYISSGTVASAYDAWTQDKLLERLWGENMKCLIIQENNLLLEQL